MKRGIFFIASIALSLFAQCELHAGLVISSVASLSSQTATTATMLVSVYGERNGAPNPEQVSSFGVKLTINGVAPTISSPSFAPASSEWFAFNNKPAPTITANSVTFQSYKTPLGDPNVPISSVGKNASTLIDLG